MKQRWSLLPVALLAVASSCGGGSSSPSGGSSGAMTLTEASNGFGLMLPHQTFRLGSTSELVAIRTVDDLVNNVTPSNPVLPVTSWPTGTLLPNGDQGNHFIYVEFKQDIAIDTVLTKSSTGQANSGLLGPIQVLAVDPINAQTQPVQGRAFIGGKSYFGTDPNNAPNLMLEQLVSLDSTGKPVANVVNGQTPGLGFPGTESAIAFNGAAKLVQDNVFVFVVDSDGDLTTHEAFPANRQIRLRATTAVQARNGNELSEQIVASATVGADTLTPEVSVTPPPGSQPLTVPAFGDVDVDPQTKIRIQFTEPIQPLSLGALPDGTPATLSSSIEVKFGPTGQVTKVPFTALPLSVFDLTTWELTMAFPFPGNGPVLAGCDTFSTVTVDVITDQLEDLSVNSKGDPNRNLLPASTNFQTGEGPGLVNAPVAPDAIYVGRTGASPGISVVDLNGFGQSTGNPAFDFTYTTFAKGNSNFPNNPNLIQYGPTLHPPLFPGTCTVDGGSAGVFTLTLDSSLDSLLLRPPLVTTVGDMMLGEALDVIFNNGKDSTGCQQGGGNFCAITGKKNIQSVFQTANPPTLGPPSLTTGVVSTTQVPGGENVISWAPHPNPPALIYPPLCQQPFIGGQEPTSFYSTDLVLNGGLGFVNLLVPGLPLGNPLAGIPPSGLLTRFQNSFFQGPDRASLTSTGQCKDHMVRQQIGQFLYVIDRARREIVVLNSNRFTVIERIPVPDPTDLAIAPNLDFLAVSNQTADTVTFIDIDPRSASFHQPVKTTTVGRGPRGIAWDPGNEDILVCNEAENTVSVLSAFSFEVRNVVKGHLNQPFDVVITQRQDLFGFFRNVYFGWILSRNGDLTIFESGPNGVNGWGFDDTIGVAPFTFDQPKKIAVDMGSLNGSVWVVHQNQLNPDGTKSNQPGGAVTKINIDSAISGVLPLAGNNFANNPQFRDMGLTIDVSIGPDQLTGIPVDIAFDNQNNLGGVVGHNVQQFSVGTPKLLNGKSLVRRTTVSGYVPTVAPQLCFLAVPNSSEGPGVIDVIDIDAGNQRVDTDRYLPGTQSIPAPGAITVMDYWRQ